MANQPAPKALNPNVPYSTPPFRENNALPEAKAFFDGRAHWGNPPTVPGSSSGCTSLSAR